MTTPVCDPIHTARRIIREEDHSPSLTIAAVVVYRLISCWIPTLPRLAAYFQLRRRMTDWQPSAELA